MDVAAASRARSKETTARERVLPCMPKVTRAMNANAEPADTAMVLWCVMLNLVCQFAHKANMAVVAVPSRNGPVTRVPRLIVVGLNGGYEKRCAREKIRPHSVDAGRQVTRNKRIVVGAMRALGTWRIVAP